MLDEDDPDYKLSTDKYSCKNHYVNKENATALDEFLADEFPFAVKEAIRKLLPSYRKLLEVRGKIVEDSEENGVEVFATAYTWLQNNFSHPDQINYISPLIRALNKALRKGKTQKALPLKSGTTVQWDDPKWDERVEGIIFRVYQGQVSLAVLEGKHKGARRTFRLKNFRQNMNVEIIEYTAEDDD